MAQSVFNGAAWTAYINVKGDGTFALRLPAVAGYCPVGKTIQFNFDSEGFTKAIQAIYKHQEYVSTPFKKKKLPVGFVDNLIRDRQS